MWNGPPQISVAKDPDIWLALIPTALRKSVNI
jgi:hypothetical protein